MHTYMHTYIHTYTHTLVYIHMYSSRYISRHFHIYKTCAYYISFYFQTHDNVCKTVNIEMYMPRHFRLCMKGPGYASMYCKGVSIHIYIYVYLDVYIYIHIERERDIYIHMCTQR